MYMAYESKEEKNKLKDWKAEFIYMMDIEIIKGIELQTQADCEAYVKTECGDRQFITKNQNTANPEWNEKTQFLFYTAPEKLVFSLIEAANDSLIGQSMLGLTDFFNPDHEGFSACVDITKGKLDIRVKCTKLEPFKVVEQWDKFDANEQHIKQCNTQNQETEDAYNTIQDRLNTYGAEKTSMSVECANKREELNTYTKTGEQYDREIKAVAEECKALDQDGTEDIVERMHDYAKNLTLEEDQSVEEEEEEMDVAVIKTIISAYKAADHAAKKNNIKKAEYDKARKADQSAEQEKQLKANKQKAERLLTEIRKWKNSCDEAYENDADKWIAKWSYKPTESPETVWFRLYYVALSKMFLNLQIVGATLDVFESAVKRVAKRPIRKCTLDDLREKTEGKRESVWESVYDNKLGVVMEELNEIYPVPPIRDAPIQLLCDKSAKLIRERYKGYSARFCRLISHYVVQHLVEDGTLPNHQEDAIVAVICLLFDKHEFCLKLHRSMADAAAKQAETRKDDDDGTDAKNEEDNGGGGGDDEEDEDEDEEPFDQYEKIVARIIIAIGRLWDSALIDDLLDESAQKEIDKEWMDVLELCTTLRIDERSQKRIEKFFGYFFKPDSGAVCCGGGDAEGASWIGQIFGSICRG